ncbi:MAG: hypothetical protein J6S12_01980 [Alphaproteobacteria bacterium]|nr:hypothetical protein [Alphaproteobacteria bacterium]
MAYTKTVWETGDIITAAKLNNMEDGIEEHDAMILSSVGTQSGSNWDFAFNGITFGDVVSAVQAGKIVRLVLTYDVNTLVVTVTGCQIFIDSDVEKVYSMQFSAYDVMMKQPEDDYPAFTDSFALYISGME